MDKFTYEPLKEYDLTLKNEFHKNCEDFFESLVNKSNIDVSANKKVCEEYYNVENSKNSISKTINKLRVLKIFSIILAMLSIGLFFVAVSGESFDIVKFVISLLLLIVSLFLLFGVVNKRIKNNKKLKEELLKKMINLKNVANSILQPLFVLFDYLIPKRLIEKTLPSFKLDDYFLYERYDSLVNNYNMSENLSGSQSTTSVVSGTFNDYPFAMFTKLNQTMQNKTYTGMLTIHWTTVERDSNGKTYTKHHSQVLTAHSIHPVPSYYYSSNLVYANDSAPDLSFSRVPSDIAGLSDKQLEKKVEKTGKKLDKKTQKDINFTSMANTEFEALFGAINRDNEMQFRLMFTPLAQKNEVEFIKDKKYFGDDFSFYKNKKINVISSKHSQGFDFSGSPLNYMTFDFDKVKELFFSYNENYFKNLYFDFIPLLNIPIYQQTKPQINALNRNYSRWNKNFTEFDAECLANVIEDDFAPVDAKTRSILKTKHLSSKNGIDTFVVTANSFNTENRIDYIPVLGGDGNTHLVPVPWEEFLPIYSKAFFEITRYKNDGEVWQVNQRGLKARIKN